MISEQVGSRTTITLYATRLGVLFGDDVIDVKRIKRLLILMKPAILAAVARSMLHADLQGRGHQGRELIRRLPAA